MRRIPLTSREREAVSQFRSLLRALLYVREGCARLVVGLGRRRRDTAHTGGGIFGQRDSLRPMLRRAALEQRTRRRGCSVQMPDSALSGRYDAYNFRCPSLPFRAMWTAAAYTRSRDFMWLLV